VVVVLEGPPSEVEQVLVVWLVGGGLARGEAGGLLGGLARGMVVSIVVAGN
jgi:hypothetical protein